MRNRSAINRFDTQFFGLCLCALMASLLAYMMVQPAKASPSAIDTVVSGQLVPPAGVDLAEGLRVALFFPDYEDPSIPFPPPPPFLPPAATPPVPTPHATHSPSPTPNAPPRQGGLGMPGGPLQTLMGRSPADVVETFIYAEPVAVADVDATTGEFVFNLVPKGGYILHVLPPEGSNLIAQSIPYVDVISADLNLGSITLREAQIHGALFEPDGTTSADGYVNLYSVETELVSTARTVDGRFFFGQIPVGNYYFIAQPSAYESDFYRSDPISITVVGAEPDLTTHRLNFSGPDLHGKVLDPFGQPMYGVEIIIEAIDQSSYSQAYSVENGEWQIGNLADGAYTLTAQNYYNTQDYLPPFPLRVDVPTDNGPITVQFTEWPTGLKTINGQARDTNGDAALNGVVIAYEPIRGFQREAVLDEAGEFSFDLVGGTWFFDLYSNSYDESRWVNFSPAREVEFQLDESVETAEVEFTVSRYDATVTGFVVSDDESIPLPSYEINFYNSEYSISVSAQQNQGEPFELKAPAGTYDYYVYPHSDQFLQTTNGTVTLHANETVDMGEIVLISPSATIKGKVTGSAGENVSGVEVYAYRIDGNDFARYGRTDANGNFELKVTPGEWGILIDTFYLTDYFYSGEPIFVVPSKGETIEGVNFEVKRLDSHIVGQLVDEQGERLNDVEGYAVAYSAANSFYKENYFSDGTFNIALFEGQFDLNVVSHQAGHFTRRNLPVTVGVQEDLVVEIPVLSSNAKITGQIVDMRTEEPVGGLGGYVHAVTADYNFFNTDAYISPTSNQFEIDIRDGRWDIGWSLERYDGLYLPVNTYSNVFDVEPDDTISVDLEVVRRDASIAGSILDPAGKPVPYSYVHLWGQDDLDGVDVYMTANDSGAFYSTLPYGTYQVFVSGYFNEQDNGAFPPNQLFLTIEPDQDLRDVLIQFETADVPLSGSIFAPGLTESGDLNLFLSSDGGGQLYLPVDISSNGTDGVGQFSTLVNNGTWTLTGDMAVGDEYWHVSGPISVDGNTEIELILHRGDYFLTPESGEVHSESGLRLELSNGASVEIGPAAVPADDDSVTIRLETGSFLPLNGQMEPIGFNYLLMAHDSQNHQLLDMVFAEPISVTVPYPEAIAEHVALGEIEIVAQTVTAARSDIAPTVITDVQVDEVNHTFSFTVDQVGYFGIMAPVDLLPASPAFSDMFPNRLYLPVVGRE